MLWFYYQQYLDSVAEWVCYEAGVNLLGLFKLISVMRNYLCSFELTPALLIRLREIRPVFSSHYGWVSMSKKVKVRQCWHFHKCSFLCLSWMCLTRFMHLKCLCVLLMSILHFVYDLFVISRLGDTGLTGLLNCIWQQVVSCIMSCSIRHFNSNSQLFVTTLWGS